MGNELKSSLEQEITPRDVSAEFLSMSSLAFLEFLKTQKDEPFLSIRTDWKDVWQVNRLKAWLEDHGKQKRSATVRCTVEQRREGANAFSSGVKCEIIDK